MSTPRRVQFPGAVYHVTTHAVDGLWPFEENAEKERLLHRLAISVAEHKLECHAYCVMSNHYHLLLRTPEQGLSEAMQRLNASVASGFNRRHARRGHVFEAPYDAVLVEEDAHLVEVARYDVLNPVRAKMIDAAEDYEWSSYRATAGLEHAPRFLRTDWLLARLGGAERYREFVADGAPAATLEGLLLRAP